MSKIVRYQFLGNRYWFWLLCVTVVGLPVAVLYLSVGQPGDHDHVERAR
jgi:hypothetical protein